MDYTSQTCLDFRSKEGTNLRPICNCINILFLSKVLIKKVNKKTPSQNMGERDLVKYLYVLMATPIFYSKRD